MLDVARAIAAAYEFVIAAPLHWVQSRGFADVTPAILTVMVAIEVAGTSLADLQRVKGRSKQAVSQIVDELRRRGYAELVASPADGRSKLVVPTERGLALRAIGLDAERRLSEVVEQVLGEDASDLAARLLALADALADPSRGPLALPIL